MTARLLLQALSLLITACGCLIFPFVGIRALMPVLEKTAPSVSNYRGRRLCYGLGVVWLLWVGGAFAAGTAQSVVADLVRAVTGAGGSLSTLAPAESWPARNAPALALVACAFGFGLVDDLFGDRSDRGFGGHIGAMLHGRLTTGGLKLLGIGAASAFAAVSVANGGPGGQVTGYAPGWPQFAVRSGAWVLATLVIALTANLVNLTDLRPGRAWKAYSLLVLIALVIGRATLAEGVFVVEGAAIGQPSPHPWIEWVAGTAAALIAVYGPVVAGWRIDLEERSMLGDAGANAAGAFAGYLLASSLSLVGLGVAAAILLLLNLASERISFSEVIDRNRLLRWIDGLGRVRDEKVHPTGQASDGAARTR